MKFLLPILSVAAACLGLYFVLTPDSKAGSKELLAPGYLASRVPEKFGAVVSQERPLGETEEVVRASESLLSVSDYLNRNYTLSDGRTVSLYISYWKPTKETLERATTHTPDRCWIKNGWQCNPQTRRLSDIVKVGDRELLPARYGEYSIKAPDESVYTRYVWYWFVADGKIYEYSGSNYIPSLSQWVRNALKSATADAPEMYFVRVDADFPLDRIRHNADFQKLLDYLGKMILYKPENSEENGTLNK